jgi:hypothetical protein
MAEADVVSLHLSVITIGELRHGTLRLPVGKRRTSLSGWSGRGPHGEHPRRSRDLRQAPASKPEMARWLAELSGFAGYELAK